MSAPTDLFDLQAKRELVQFDAASPPGPPVPADTGTTRLVRIGRPLEDHRPRFRNVDVLVLAELPQHTTDIGVAKVLQDLAHETNVAVREIACDDIKLPEGSARILDLRSMRSNQLGNDIATDVLHVLGA